MSERGDKLLDVIEEAWEWDATYDAPAQAPARSICEHLGLTWENADRWATNKATRDIFATLLEAAGVER